MRDRPVNSRVALIIATEALSGVIDALTDLGFRFESPAAELVTVLDTFDGRLYRDRTRLTLHERPHHELVLVLDGGGTVPARIEPQTTPRFASDSGRRLRPRCRAG